MIVNELMAEACRPQDRRNLFLASRLLHPGLGLPGLQTWKFQKSPQDALSGLGVS